MKSFFEEGVYDEIISRVAQIDNHSKKLWGKMTAAQMLHHCQIPLNVILQKEDYNLKPNYIINLLFKKSMYNDKLWRKNMPTAPDFRVKDYKDLSTEKEHLLKLLKELNDQRHRTDWHNHPSFGKLTKEQWGKMQYKHLDHHLRQFGV